MAGSVVLTGNDVVTLNGRVFHDFANGDVAKLTFSADLIKVQPSKNGNVIYSLDVAGNLSKLELMLLIGSSDDQYLNSLLAGQLHDLATTVLVIGSFVKRVGNGGGDVTNVIYNVSGGIVMRFPDASMNTSGDAKQSISTWALNFGQNSRVVM